MTGLRVVARMPKGSPISEKDLLDACHKTAKNLGTRVKRTYAELTSDWRTDGERPIDVPVVFNKKTTRLTHRIRVEVKTDSLKYKYVDLGTESHPIDPKPDNPTGLLKFPSEYSPRTSVKSLKTKRGGKNWGGPWTITPHVEHPGNKGRQFEVPIIAEQIPIIRRELINNISKKIKFNLEEL